MEAIGATVFRLVAVIATLMCVWLCLGPREARQLGPADIVIFITTGTIAGAAVIDERIGLAPALVSVILLGTLQVAVSWASVKFRMFNRRIHFHPVVVVRDGNIVKAGLRKLRLPVETLMELLRERGVFDITTLEIAVMEPHGKVSVLPKPSARPLTAADLGLKPPPNRVLVPVVIEGELQETALRRHGFSTEDIRRFQERHGPALTHVFVALMDREHAVHLVDGESSGDGQWP